MSFLPTFEKLALSWETAYQALLKARDRRGMHATEIWKRNAFPGYYPPSKREQHLRARHELLRQREHARVKRFAAYAKKKPAPDNLHGAVGRGIIRRMLRGWE